MTTTYTLKITEVEVAPQNDLQGVVVRAHWAYEGDNGSKQAAVGGSTPLVYTPGSPFTPLDTLTEAQVAGWVLAAWTPADLTRHRASIDTQLAIAAASLPWAPATAAE